MTNEEEMGEGGINELGKACDRIRNLEVCDQYRVKSIRNLATRADEAFSRVEELEKDLARIGDEQVALLCRIEGVEEHQQKQGSRLGKLETRMTQAEGASAQDAHRMTTRLVELEEAIDGADVAGSLRSVGGRLLKLETKEDHPLLLISEAQQLEIADLNQKAADLEEFKPHRVGACEDSIMRVAERVERLEGHTHASTEQLTVEKEAQGRDIHDLSHRTSEAFSRVEELEKDLARIGDSHGDQLTCLGREIAGLLQKVADLEEMVRDHVVPAVPGLPPPPTWNTGAISSCINRIVFKSGNSIPYPPSYLIASRAEGSDTWHCASVCTTYLEPFEMWMEIPE